MIKDFNIKTNKKVLEKNSVNASIFRIMPKGVFVPKSKDELLSFVREIIKQKKENKDSSISLTPRAAGTCMSGGSLTQEYIISFTEYLNKIISFDLKNRNVEVEPGMFYRDFEKETLKHNLIMPTYPASRELCAIGGMVGNNAGGEKTLKYGKVADFVESIDMICADGNEYNFRELKGQDLDDVLNKDNTFYGDLHRSILNIIKNNKSEIENNKPRVSKNSSGYYIWDVYNEGGHSINLAGLIVGSQGTLGVNTSVKFRLVENNKNSQMAVIFLDDIKDMPFVVDKILPLSPESFEIYDDHTFKIAMRFLPQIIMRLGGNIFSLLKLFWPEIKMVLSGNIPKVVMLAEFVEKDIESLNQKMDFVSKIFNDIEKDNILNKKIKTHIVQSDREAEKYWVFRRESFNLLRSKLKDVRTVPFIEDVVVKSMYLPEFLPRFEKILDEGNLVYTIAGHIGDGNIHVIPLMNLKDQKTIESLKIISDKVYALVKEYNGSLSGEHNDGLIRAPFLHYMFTEKMLDIFKEIKSTFDPDNIFNPNKKIGIDWEYAKQFIDSRK